MPSFRADFLFFFFFFCFRQEQVCDPDEMLSKGLRLNARYYINKVVLPALDRVFSLVGVNVRLWCVNLFVSLFVCADSCFV